MIKKFAISMLLLSVSSGMQAATYTTYTVKADFLAATAGFSLSTEDFEAVVGEPSFANNTSLVVNDITLLSTSDVAPTLFNKIEQQPAQFPGNDPTGSTFAHALTFDPGDYFSISFANPTNVFAADLAALNDDGLHRTDLFVGLDLLALGADSFFGFVSDTAFSEVRFTRTAASDGYGVDNVMYGDVSPIPVPAAFWLFGTALIGFIGISRRRKVA